MTQSRISSPSLQTTMLGQRPLPQAPPTTIDWGKYPSGQQTFSKAPSLRGAAPLARMNIQNCCHRWWSPMVAWKAGKDSLPELLSPSTNSSSHGRRLRRPPHNRHCWYMSPSFTHTTPPHQHSIQLHPHRQCKPSRMRYLTYHNICSNRILAQTRL